MTVGATAAQALLLAVAVGVVAAIVYWLVFLTEGAYLGARAVRFLYDRDAANYEGIKGFHRADEVMFLANPLFNRLASGAGPGALILDVATGTARLPVAMFDLPFFQGNCVGVDISRHMLEIAVAKTTSWSDRRAFVHAPAEPLPFADASFDAVSMLEALEFLPDRNRALAEMVRVLRPGGSLLVTNRIGTDALLMPGRVDDPRSFEMRLSRLGLVDIETCPWMTYYALVFARKPGSHETRAGQDPWWAALLCPSCGTAGMWSAALEAQLVCGTCCARIASSDDIWRLG